MKHQKQLGAVLKLFVRVLFKTIRFRDHPTPRPADQKTGTIYCTWHENIISAVKRISFTGTHCIVSPSSDGEILADLLKNQGCQVIAGSSGRGGTKAIREAVKALKNGEDVYITPDGSRGPRRELKKGLAMIAQISGAPVIVVNYRQGSYFRFKSWDRFIMPLFFTKIETYAKEPLRIEEINLDGEERSSEFLRLVSEKMNEENPPIDHILKLFTGLK